jgi:hypothetical protein
LSWNALLHTDRDFEKDPFGNIKKQDLTPGHA